MRIGVVVEVVPFALVGLLALGGFLATRARRRRKQQALERLLQRHRSLQPTAAPLGLDRRTLEDRCRSLPRGDRRFGLEYGVQGPLSSPVPGWDTDLDCAAFRWWWERRRHGGQQAQHSHRYRRLATTVALVRLPTVVPTPLRLRPESVLGRLGVRRAGRQVESSEFNRRFRVECADDHLALSFLDARMQALLLEEFAGRGVELVDDLLVLEGAPSHRDGSLMGVVGELPAVRQDAGRLLAAVPEQLWRRLGEPQAADPVARGWERPHG
jgi:hypothetical protein